MRKLAIFVISLPLLALAVAIVPIGLGLLVFAGPIWLFLNLIMTLRGKEGEWGIFLVPPLMGFSIYSEITGLIPDPLDRI